MHTRSRRVVEPGVETSTFLASSGDSAASLPTDISVDITSESCFEEPVVTTVVSAPGSSSELLPNGYDLLRPGSPYEPAPDTPTITRIIVSMIK